MEPFHNFTIFKEHDDVKRLQYCNNSVVKCVTHVYDIIQKFLRDIPYILNIRKSIYHVIIENVDFSFIKCSIHTSAIKKQFLFTVINCVIYKFIEDNRRHFVNNQRNKFKKNLHL